jgi:hypothetical protein
MKNLCSLLLICLIIGASTSAVAKEKNISAPPVGVKEEFTPSTEDIHRDVPIEQKCSSCHTEANQDIQSKPVGHFMTHRECDQCHLDKSWIPLRIYRHLSGKYRPNASPQECDSCHTTNSEYRANYN